MRAIPVFYRPEQNAPPQADSPSAAKPQYVVESWLNRFGEQVELHNFQPALISDIARVHAGEYVLGVMEGRIDNGFGNTSAAVAKSLLYTTGSFMAAARYALVHGVACSPTSGFHHAGYDSAEGFCTFNGLMVAAALLTSSERYHVARVGILDCDAHYGNGTDDIRRRCQMRKFVWNFTRRGHAPAFNVYLHTLRTLLKDWKQMSADIVFYQAGADPHINDPYGGHYTSAELRERDHVVFSTCKELGLPVVWNLAGGYQVDVTATEGDFAARIRPVLDIHDATMDECIKVYQGDKS